METLPTEILAGASHFFSLQAQGNYAQTRLSCQTYMVAAKNRVDLVSWEGGGGGVA